MPAVNNPWEDAQDDAPVQSVQLQPNYEIEEPEEAEYSPPARFFSFPIRKYMFGASIGGAIMGALLTLLILAWINGGTLSWSDNGQLNTLEDRVEAVDQNLGSIYYNLQLRISELDKRLQTLEAAQE